MKPVSIGIAIRSWLSRISRSSVEPLPMALTMKMGPFGSVGIARRV